MDPLELAPEVGEPRRIKRKKSPEKAKSLENPAGEPQGLWDDEPDSGAGRIAGDKIENVADLPIISQTN